MGSGVAGTMPMKLLVIRVKTLKLNGHQHFVTMAINNQPPVVGAIYFAYIEIETFGGPQVRACRFAINQGIMRPHENRLNPQFCNGVLLMNLVNERCSKPTNEIQLTASN